MAISHRGHTAAASPADSTAVAVTLPAGILGGDVILLGVGWNNAGSGVTCSTPTGYTLLDSKVTSAGTLSIFWKIAAGTVGAASSDASASISATLSVSKSWTIAADVYGGTDTTTPIHAHNIGGPSGTGTTHTAPTVTVSSANCWIVEFIEERGTSTAWTVPTGFTARGVPGQTTGVANTLASSADSNGVVSTGTLGGDTWTATASSSAVSVATIALQPLVSNPTAAFSYTRAGLGLTVNGSTSAPVSPATITGYDWDWGDGTTHGTGATPAAHSYATAGTYTVNLTVTDSNSLTGSLGQSITIEAPASTVTVESISLSAGWTASAGTALACITDGDPTTFLTSSTNPSALELDVILKALIPVATGQPLKVFLTVDAPLSTSATVNAQLFEGVTQRSSIAGTVIPLGSGSSVGSTISITFPYTDLTSVTTGGWNALKVKLQVTAS